MSEAPYPSLALRFTIHGLIGQAHALVDTGFDDYLVVPTSLIAALPYPWHRQRLQVADGAVIEVPAYPGTIELLDRPGPINAYIFALGDEYLLGLATLNHFKVTFDHGQRVIVEP